MMIIRVYIFVLYKIILNCTVHTEEILCFVVAFSKVHKFNGFEKYNSPGDKNKR